MLKNSDPGFQKLITLPDHSCHRMRVQKLPAVTNQGLRVWVNSKPSKNLERNHPCACLVVAQSSQNRNRLLHLRARLIRSDRQGTCRKTTGAAGRQPMDRAQPI
jgi:hypothetical protein